jgi:predicted phosphodiesterase
MSTKKKTLGDFEKKHGGSKIAALEAALKQQAAARHPIHLELPSATNILKFGVIGDTHYGSRYEATDAIEALYRWFDSNGVENVLHAGDVLDGHKVYHGQEFELHSHGWAEQRDWFIKHAPKIEGITTHFITGNHDNSMKKAAGVDVGSELADRRPDWNFLGEDYATIRFNTPSGGKFVVGLMHPSGGSAYALSYRPQKITEQLEGGAKPNMLCIGHFHKAEFIPSYRNVAVLQTGCGQWQTPFMVTKGLSAHVGGWLVEVVVQPEKVLSNAIRAEFVAFYAPKR